MRARVKVTCPSLLVGVLLCLLGGSRVSAQTADRGDRTVVEIDVNEPIEAGSPFGFLNHLHATTDEEMIRRVIHRTLYTGDSLTEDNLQELRRNLLSLSPIRRIAIQPGWQAVPPDSLAITDGWSLYPEPVVTDDDDRSGLLLREHNLAGAGIELGIGTDLSSAPGSPRRIFLTFSDPELFASPVGLDLRARISDLYSEFSYSLQRTRYTDDERYLFGVYGEISDGLEVYRTGDPAFIDHHHSDSIDATRIRSQGWFGSASNEDDLFVGSASAILDLHNPDVPVPSEPAFANTYGLFVGIASVAREYQDFVGFEATGARFAPTGGMGRVSIGKFFGAGSDSTVDDLLYFGAEARQTVGADSWIAHFSVEAGTALRSKEAERTLLRGVASAGIRNGPGTLALRSTFQVVWRWPRYIYTSANGGGRILRGYEPTEVFGDNHLVGNVEYRTDPFLNLGPFAVSAALFHDLAGFWNRGNEFSSTRFHNSSGVGVRFGHGTGYSRPILRLDLAYNHDTGRLGELSIGISEAFDLFGFLGYVPPGPYLPR